MEHNTASGPDKMETFKNQVEMLWDLRIILLFTHELWFK